MDTPTCTRHAVCICRALASRAVGSDLATSVLEYLDTGLSPAVEALLDSELDVMLRSLEVMFGNLHVALHRDLLCSSYTHSFPATRFATMARLPQGLLDSLVRAALPQMCYCVAANNPCCIASDFTLECSTCKRHRGYTKGRLDTFLHDCQVSLSVSVHGVHGADASCTMHLQRIAVRTPQALLTSWGKATLQQLKGRKK